MPRAIATALILTATLAAAPQPAQAAAEDQQLEQFLARLGLVDLQILHLQQSLDRPQDNAERLASAERLADLYAGRLMADSDDPVKYQEVLRKIGLLVEKVPQAKTPSLEVMLLQAEYQRVEGLMGKSLDTPGETAARDEAVVILARITPQLDQQQRGLQATVDRLSAEVEKLPAGDPRYSTEKELQRLQPVAGRAAYFAAWCHYYQARALPVSPDASSAITRARDIFRKLLGLEGSYQELQPELLGLESIWRSRAVIGLALAEAAAGNLDGSRACFDLLNHSTTPQEIQDLVPYWRLESLLFAQQYDMALEFAKKHVAELSTSPTQGKVSFCVRLIRAAYGRPDAPPPNAKELGTLGVVGLVKMRQMNAIRKLAETYRIEGETTGGFYLPWVKGQQLLQGAEKTKSADDYRAAAEILNAALEAPEAKQDLGAASRCRYQLALCLLRLARFEEAARNFEQAVPGLKAAGDSDAVEAAWAAFVAYRTLAKTQPRFISSAIDVLNSIKRDFPKHAYARQADYQIGKLRQGSSSPAEALAELEKIPTDSPNYLAARYDMCVLLRQRWIESSGPAKDQAAARLTAAVDLYLAARGEDGQADRKLKCCLMAAEVALQRNPADGQQAAIYLKHAAPLAESLPSSSPLAAEYHYRRLQQASLAKDEAAQREHADWLGRNAAGSAYELPALVTAARSLDSVIDSGAPGGNPEAREEAYRLYGRLSEVLGNAPETLASNKNARVANSKLAEYAFQLGKYDEAASVLERILQAFPKDQGYLRRAGLAHFKAGKHARSLESWRTLLAGLEKGSEAWFEAKYYQLACLFQTDAARAQQVWDQFQLLHPDLGPQAWRDRFAAFAAKKP